MVPPSLVHLRSTESPRVSDFLQKKLKKKAGKKESRDVSKTGLELDTPPFILLLTVMLDDGHSSLMKHHDPHRIHCKRSAVPPTVLLSDSPLKSSL